MEGVHHSVLGWDEWRGCIILSQDGTSGGGASFCPRMGRVEGVHHSVLGWDLGWDEWRGCIILS